MRNSNMVQKYKKRSVEVEALQWTGDNLEELKGFVGDALGTDGENPIIHTLDGNRVVSRNDYIINGVQGGFYPCPPEIFRSIYEAQEPKMTEVIEFVLKSKDGSDSATGTCLDRKEVLRRFKDFLDAHGTHCDDYNEFHCRFVLKPQEANNV